MEISVADQQNDTMEHDETIQNQGSGSRKPPVDQVVSNAAGDLLVSLGCHCRGAPPGADIDGIGGPAHARYVDVTAIVDGSLRVRRVQSIIGMQPTVWSARKHISSGLVSGCRPRDLMWKGHSLADGASPSRPPRPSLFCRPSAAMIVFVGKAEVREPLGIDHTTPHGDCADRRRRCCSCPACV